MKVLGQRLPDAVLLVPSVVAIILLAFFLQLLSNQVRSTYVFILMYLFFGLIGILLYWRFQYTDIAFASGMTTTKRSRRVLSIAIFLTFSLAVIALETQSPGAVRPQLFYVITAVAIGLVLIRGLLTTGERRDVLWILCQVILIGLLIRLSWVYLNPYPLVSDLQFHWGIIQDSIHNAGFMGRGPYEFYPVFHLFNTGVFLLGTGTSSPSWLLPLTNSLVIVLSLSFFFLIGRSVSDDYVGLLSAVFALTGNYYFLSPMYKTNWIGVSFLLLAFLVAFRLIPQSDNRFWVVFWILAVATLLIHPVVFIALIFIIGGMFIAFAINQKEIRATLTSPVPFFSLLVLFVSYILYIHTRLFVDLVSATFGVDGSGERLGLTVNFGAVPIMSPFTEELVINFLGLTVSAILIVPGMLYCIRKYDLPKNSLALAGGIMYAVALVAVLGGVGGGLSVTRLLLYISPFTAPFMAIGIYYIAGNLISGLDRASTHRVLAVIFVFVVIIGFTSLSSHRNNFNGSYTNHIEHMQLTVKPSTLGSHEFLQKSPNGTSITGDRFTLQYIASSPTSDRGMHTLNRTTRQFYDPNWTQSDIYIVNEHALRQIQSDINPNYTQLDGRFNTTMSRVYSNTDLSMYHK